MDDLFDAVPIPRLVLRLGLPAMLAQAFNILYSVVDRIFVGHLPGSGSLAAACIRRYAAGLPGVAVQYALVDGLTAMGGRAAPSPSPSSGRGCTSSSSSCSPSSGRSRTSSGAPPCRTSSGPASPRSSSSAPSDRGWRGRWADLTACFCKNLPRTD